MKLSKKQLDLKNGIEREWIITNGIGGYASSTVLGTNTRRYHGLLVAPLKPPAMIVTLSPDLRFCAILEYLRC